MVVTDAERKLAEELHNFKVTAMHDICILNYGVDAILNTLKKDEVNENAAKFSKALKELHFLISSFDIICLPESNDLTIEWQLSAEDKKKSIEFLDVEKTSNKEFIVFIKEFEREFCIKNSIVIVLADGLIDSNFDALNIKLNDLIKEYCNTVS